MNINMKQVSIIGGGISGCFAAIKIKEKHPEYNVSIYEHNDKLLKKLYVTGNGKCNFSNQGSLIDKYKNEKFALKIIDDFNNDDIRKTFNEYGIHSKEVDDLIYPYSESAETVAIKLLKQIEELKIDVNLNIEVLDYDNNQIKTDRGTFSFDILIISVGGLSHPKLGSNGGLYASLKKHGYRFIETRPSLCPIKTKENTKMVEGLRSKVHASLYQNDKFVHEEDGELLYKKDGLSGMVIFNMTHYINRLDNLNNITIHLDFAKGVDDDMDSLFHPRLVKYLSDNKLDFHNTIYTFKSFYDYEFSQVTSGGIDIDNLNENLSSKKEKNIFFIGEVVDVDAVCGGYNIMWALASAKRVADSF